MHHPGSKPKQAITMIESSPSLVPPHPPVNLDGEKIPPDTEFRPTIDLRDPLPPLPELMANGGRLLVTLILREMPYREYLKTQHWDDVRRASLALFHYRCGICLQSKPLDVHHVDTTYESRGRETPKDTMPLCRKCHGMQHDLLRAQTRAQMEARFAK